METIELITSFTCECGASGYLFEEDNEQFAEICYGQCKPDYPCTEDNCILCQGEIAIHLTTEDQLQDYLLELI